MLQVDVHRRPAGTSVVHGIPGLTILVGLLNGVYGDVALSRGNTTTAGG